MAKKKEVNVELEVTTKTKRAYVKKDNKNLEVQATETEQHVKIDTKKLDIEVTKTAEGSKVTVQSDNKVLEKVGSKVGSWILKHLSKKK
jgi:hypothetical protein